MKAKNNKNKLHDDILKTIHRDSRNEEIALYGKTLNHNSVVANKKAYTRKVKHKEKYL